VGPLLLGLGVVLGFTFCGGISQADLWCNEAVAHLDECCPQFVAAMYACEGPQFPVGCENYSFDVESGKRIALSTCQQLVAGGTCENPQLPPATGRAP
jgi:hypothetical protein